MPTPDDLAEVIARLRDALKNAPGHSNTAVRVDDLRAILDAAEAGMNARSTIEELTCGDVNAAIRDMALEEAAKVAEAADDTDFLAWKAGCCDVIARRIRALKEKTNGKG